MTQTPFRPLPPSPYGPPPVPGAVPPPAPAAPPPGSVRAAGAARRGDVRRFFEGTPGHLRIAGAVAVLACLAFSLLGAWAFESRAGALADARADAGQLIRVQQITTDLVAADSDFTNGYLANGTESPALRADYDGHVANAAAFIAKAASAGPADEATLETVADTLTQYTDRVASARYANRKGDQVATGYLRQASVLLRGDGKSTTTAMLPLLQQLTDANAARVDDAYAASRRATWILVGASVLALGGLAAVQVWLARRTRRFVNLPLAVASGAVLVVLVVGSLAMAAVQSKADDVYDTSYTALRGVAGARIAAYTAKSAESIALIYYGTGGPYGTARDTFASATATAQTRLDDARKAAGGDLGAGDQLGAWKTADAAVWKQATSGDWQGAAKAASDPSGAVNTTFTAFDKVTDTALRQQATAVDTDLDGGRGLITVLGWVALVLGLLSAVASWAGVTQRLEEYR